MSEPIFRTQESKRNRRAWKLALVVLVVGAVITGLFAFFSSRHPRADYLFEVFLGLLAVYAGVNAMMTGVCINAFNILPFVVAGDVNEKESPNFYAINVILCLLIGLAFVAHGGWRFVR